AGALITGGTYGISINTGALTLTNDGVITGKNYALGLSVTASNTVTNFGTIKSTLQSAFRFSGSSTAAVGQTIIKGGAIIAGGSTAISFGAGNDLLKLYPGASFVGKVDGRTGNNTLELASSASAGIITAIGTNFANFGTIAVDSGAQWTIAG